MEMIFKPLNLNDKSPNVNMTALKLRIPFKGAEVILHLNSHVQYSTVDFKTSSE